MKQLDSFTDVVELLDQYIEGEVCPNPDSEAGDGDSSGGFQYVDVYPRGRKGKFSLSCLRGTNWDATTIADHDGFRTASGGVRVWFREGDYPDPQEDAGEGTPIDGNHTLLRLNDGDDEGTIRVSRKRFNEMQEALSDPDIRALVQRRGYDF